MQFAHTWQKVLSGEKTQTRRIVKPGEYGCLGTSEDYTMVAAANGRWVYQVGKDYAVCPGRGKAQVARIRITGIRREDAREISDADALAEGFDSKVAFWRLWYTMHDCPDRDGSKIPDKYWEYRKSEIPSVLGSRYHENYQAWVLEFALADTEGRVGDNWTYPLPPAI